jgi:hypothetical protein
MRIDGLENVAGQEEKKRGKQVNQYVRSTSLIQALYWAHHHH